MAEKYLYGSLVTAAIWVVACMFLGDDAMSFIFVLCSGAFFVILCYIIGLLKDIRAKLGIHEIGSEEKFFFEGEDTSPKEQNTDVEKSQSQEPKEDKGK